MSHKALKILLVHDATGSRLKIRDLLSKTGFAQFELDAVSTDVAFRGIRLNHYGVCLIDSAVKGIWLLKESRRVGFAAPTIVLTSNSAYKVLSAMRQAPPTVCLRRH